MKAIFAAIAAFSVLSCIYALRTSVASNPSRSCSKIWSSRPPQRNSDGPVNNNDQQGGERDWKSGRIFNKKPQSNGRRRNDPWWMREEEMNNPRVLPVYKPWWVESVMVDDSWKVADLREEAIRRGLPSKGKKDELITILRESSELYDLSDSGFRAPNFIKLEGQRPTCYPEVYERDGAQALLSKKAFSNQQPPPGR
jgi:SAP domain